MVQLSVSLLFSEATKVEEPMVCTNAEDDVIYLHHFFMSDRYLSALILDVAIWHLKISVSEAIST